MCSSRIVTFSHHSCGPCQRVPACSCFREKSQKLAQFAHILRCSDNTRHVPACRFVQRFKNCQLALGSSIRPHPSPERSSRSSQWLEALQRGLCFGFPLGFGASSFICGSLASVILLIFNKCRVTFWKEQSSGSLRRSFWTQTSRQVLSEWNVSHWGSEGEAGKILATHFWLCCEGRLNFLMPDAHIISH